MLYIILSTFPSNDIIIFGYCSSLFKEYFLSLCVYSTLLLFHLLLNFEFHYLKESLILSLQKSLNPLNNQ